MIYYNKLADEDTQNQIKFIQQYPDSPNAQEIAWIEDEKPIVTDLHVAYLGWYSELSADGDMSGNLPYTAVRAHALDQGFKPGTFLFKQHIKILQTMRSYHIKHQEEENKKDGSSQA